MTDAEVLLNGVTEFSRWPCFVLFHNRPVVFPKIAFIGKHLFYRVFGMTTGGDTQREIRAVIVGGRGHFRDQDKSVTGINGSMLFDG